MARKKTTTTTSTVSVKIGQPEHAKLRIIAAHQGRDVADVLTELAREPVDALWRICVKAQNDMLD